MELRHLVALEGDIADNLVRHGVAFAVEGIEGDVHRLLVGGKEQMATELTDTITGGGGILNQVGTASIGAGETRDWVDAAATRRPSRRVILGVKPKSRSNAAASA